MKTPSIPTQIEVFAELGKKIACLLETDFFDAVVKQQSIENKWFTEENCRFALQAIANMLDKESLALFFQKYHDFFQKKQRPQKIAVISAGNIPCAAFHDFFCILVSGNQFIGKLSKQDALLLPLLSKLLIEIEPDWKERIVFVDKLPRFDKVIATGNNNSARYFEYYFKNHPLLLRKNRNSVAILTGIETEVDLSKLSIDVFQYFGLGCRSVSKLYVPKNYDFQKLVEIFQEQTNALLLHTGYANNYEYHRAIYSLNNKPFYDGNSFLLVENQSLASPIAVIYYEEYESIGEVREKVQKIAPEIQCIVAESFLFENSIHFGDTQSPTLLDYPDKEDIMKFCMLNVPE